MNHRNCAARLARLEALTFAGDRERLPAYVCLSEEEYERLASGARPWPACKIYVGVCPDDWGDP